MDKIKQIVNYCEERDIQCSQNVLLSNYTSFKIGGVCKVLIEPKNKTEISSVIKFFKKEDIRYYVMGMGSNVLFSDDGYDGAIIRIENLMCGIELIDETTIKASAGVRMIDLAHFAYINSLTGAEFCFGIPGAIGGGVYMNAGAYFGEMSQIVSKCHYIDGNGEEKVLTNDELQFSYRHSFFTDNDGIITDVYFSLKKGNKDEIKEYMTDKMVARYTKQPLEYPSAGSTFKRPNGGYASALIDECGLKGFEIGKARVSEKHAGFIINSGGATCEDVLNLISYVQKVVKEKTGFELEPELKVIK